MLVRIKSKEEIEGFSIAGKIAAEAMDLIVKSCISGTTTLELDEIARDFYNKENVKSAFLGYRGFPAAICVSINNELVHGIPDNRHLSIDDIVKIDIGVDYEGFIGDIAKTIKVGWPSSFGDNQFCNYDKMVSDCEWSLLLAINKATPYSDIGEIGDEITRVANRGGWKVITDYGGHGIDRYKLHSDPFVPNKRTYEKLKLRPGMVIAIEPMFVNANNSNTSVDKNGWTVLANGPTAHFEHTIVISDFGSPRILTMKGEE